MTTRLALCTLHQFLIVTVYATNWGRQGFRLKISKKSHHRSSYLVWSSLTFWNYSMTMLMRSLKRFVGSQKFPMQFSSRHLIFSIYISSLSMIVVLFSPGEIENISRRLNWDQLALTVNWMRLSLFLLLSNLRYYSRTMSEIPKYQVNNKKDFKNIQ